jgi:hypothetical protein
MTTFARVLYATTELTRNFCMGIDLQHLNNTLKSRDIYS